MSNITEQLPVNHGENFDAPDATLHALGSAGLVGNVSAFQLHQDVVARTVDTTQLSMSDKNLGGLRIDSIDDTSIVPMGDRIGLEADFHNISTLSELTPEAFDLFKKEIDQDPAFERFKTKLTMLNPEAQELELKLRFATGKAIEYFGRENKVEDASNMDADAVEAKKAERDATYSSYALDPTREDSLQVKPLSEVGNEAKCTEYAVFVKEALRHLGVDYSYVAAEKRFWNDEPSFYHSFLVSKDGKTVIDPLDAAQYFSKGLPRGVLALPQSLYESVTPLVGSESWSGRQSTYSLAKLPGNIE
ncbi:MAG: hypothetical protein JWO47_1069 [Candidatus Saccharibacteria bacterium]|nr:hypothetical protein [Candidatus Saccharibacteria bacterium]